MKHSRKDRRKQRQPVRAVWSGDSSADLRALEKRGIYCQSSVSIEHQHLARRYVLRATESGGAVADMGRYCAYLDADGTPLRGCSRSIRSPATGDTRL